MQKVHEFLSYFTILGRTFPVQQIFLDEIIEKTNYILEEDSAFARKIKEKKRNFTDIDPNSIECELGTADVLTQTALAPKDNVRDEMLSLPQLMARYSGKVIVSLHYHCLNLKHLPGSFHGYLCFRSQYVYCQVYIFNGS